MSSGRRGRRGRAGVLLAGSVVLASACSSGHEHAKAAPTTITTPVAAPATTSTTVPADPAPLTGLPQPDAAQLEDPAVVVKIDNVDAARPQTGLDHADVVYEEEVEGGLTRLAAVFQSDYPTDLGPVRSGRLTDEGIVDDLDHPVFVFSGTNDMFMPVLEAQPVTVVDDTNEPGQFQRVGDNAPHNLYISVASAARLSTTHTAPSPLFTYHGSGQTFSGADVSAAGAVTVDFPSATATWTYDASTGTWLRTQNGTPDVLADHTQISAANVVVLFVDYVSSGLETGEGQPPTEIPEGILTGGGQALFFSQGREVKGTWSRSSLTSVATYADSAGDPISLTPGDTWVELAPIGTTTTVTP